MSVESGLSTFRGSDGLWNGISVERVATHEAWLNDPVFVNDFYNNMRHDLVTKQPCRGHKLIAEMEKTHAVTVITQNVDDLHERADSTDVLHLHGELMKVCSSRDVDNPYFIKTLQAPNLDVAPGEKAGDGSLLRPYIVFFNENVPNISRAAKIVEEADVFVIIGTSLNVYPAAGLIHYTRPGTPIYLIDPNAVNGSHGHVITHIQKSASDGVEELIERINL